MQLLGYMDVCHGVTMQLLRCSEWLLACFYVVARALLCSYSAVLESVAMRLLGCSEWVLGCCYVVAKILLHSVRKSYILLSGC